jgi:UPF0755 protein
MHNFKIKFILFGLLLLIVIGLSGVAYFYIGLTAPNSNNEEKIEFKIESGQGVNEISDNLFKAGLIQNRLIFEGYLWLRNLEGEMKAGEYRLAKNLSIKDLVNILSIGQVKKEIEIKIIEGWTNEEIADYLDKNSIVGKNEFLGLADDAAGFIIANKTDYPFLSELLDRNNNQPKISLEGYLFPDTYKVYIDATAEDIVRKMLDNFDKKFTVEMREKVKSQGDTINEIIVLASIVEKEVADYENRRLVADIFLKRLKIGMPLQSDATINYITKKGTTRPSYDDLKVESAYNTYQNKGLPPGPIGNPGLAAIQAVIYPISNNYYYFLTDKEGGVHYGKNSDEHQENRAKYLN